MIESKLTELLERTGDQTAVGPPPLDALRAGAARRRRRRTVAWSAVSAVTVAAVIGGTTLLAPHAPGDPSPPVASATPAPALAGMRLVGLGHAAIAVPRDWGTNKSRCGTPQQDTVLVDDPSAALYCLAARPHGVESVELAIGKQARFGFHADQTFELDGMQAQRQRTTCSEGAINRVQVCSGAVFIPSLNVLFKADSSTSADEVDRMLERIRRVPDQAGVLGFQSLPKAAQYSAALSKAGLTPIIETAKPYGHPVGHVLAVSPAPGTMLPAGAPVRITVSWS